jgi:hypothetical protein
MVLKALYLAGHAVQKDDFRKLALAGEEHIADGDVSGMPALTRALVGALPAGAWRQRRAENHAHFRKALEGLDEARVVLRDTEGTVPFSLLLTCATPARRTHIRKRMLEAKIYPAVLWPLDQPVVAGIQPEDRDLADRILSVHCDFRYAKQDLDRVANVIREASRGAM